MWPHPAFPQWVSVKSYRLRGTRFLLGPRVIGYTPLAGFESRLHFCGVLIKLPLIDVNGSRKVDQS